MRLMHLLGIGFDAENPFLACYGNHLLFPPSVTTDDHEIAVGQHWKNVAVSHQKG